MKSIWRSTEPVGVLAPVARIGTCPVYASSKKSSVDRLVAIHDPCANVAVATVPSGPTSWIAPTAAHSPVPLRVGDETVTAGVVGSKTQSTTPFVHDIEYDVQSVGEAPAPYAGRKTTAPTRSTVATTARREATRGRVGRGVLPWVRITREVGAAPSPPFWSKDGNDWSKVVPVMVGTAPTTSPRPAPPIRPRTRSGTCSGAGPPLPGRPARTSGDDPGVRSGRPRSRGAFGGGRRVDRRSTRSGPTGPEPSRKEFPAR